MTKNLSIGRRGVFGLTISGIITAMSPLAAAQDAGAPIEPIEHLDQALLGVMKRGSGASFDERYHSLAPVIEQAFNLDAILAASIGLSWAALPESAKASLAAAFRRYTISSYVANFDSYNGQTFQIAPSTRTLGNGEVVVQSQLLRRDNGPLRLDYVMRQGPADWQAVDVLTDGTISRVAVQRSDFRGLLVSGGVTALTEGLAHKVANLTGGMSQ